MCCLRALTRTLAKGGNVAGGLVKGGKCVQVLAAVDVWELHIRVSFSQKALTRLGSQES